MKRVILVFIYISILLISCKTNKQSNKETIYRAEDALGVVHEFNTVPQKVITLAPSLTEILFELNLGDRIVGNSKFCNYPDEAKSIKNVSDMMTIDYETVLKLKPDLILISTAGNTKQSYEKLKEFGIPIFATNPRSYDDIKDSFQRIAGIFNKKDTAKTIIRNWDKRIEMINRKVETLDRKKILFLVSLKPLMPAGDDTFINEIININRMINIAEKLGKRYPIISREEVLKENPDYILIPPHGQQVNNLLDLYPEWTKINAVKNNNVSKAVEDIYFRPGPRFVNAVENLFNLLHPEIDQSHLLRQK